MDKKAIAVHEVHLSPTAVVAPNKPFSADAATVDKLIERGHAKAYVDPAAEEVVTADTIVEAAPAKGSKGGKGGKGRSDTSGL